MDNSLSAWCIGRILIPCEYPYYDGGVDPLMWNNGESIRQHSMR